MWLTEPLKQQIRNVFEPNYGRPLSEQEVIEIGTNLADFMQQIINQWSKPNEQSFSDIQH